MLKCPKHKIPDCSPLLNGCTLIENMIALRKQLLWAYNTSAETLYILGYLEAGDALLEHKKKTKEEWDNG